MATEISLLIQQRLSAQVSGHMKRKPIIALKYVSSEHNDPNRPNGHNEPNGLNRSNGRNGPNGPKERNGPNELNGPNGLNGPMSPIEPMSSIVPMAPMDPMDPTDPTNPMGPMQRTNGTKCSQWTQCGPNDPNYWAQWNQWTQWNQGVQWPISAMERPTTCQGSHPTMCGMNVISTAQRPCGRPATKHQQEAPTVSPHGRQSLVQQHVYRRAHCPQQ